MKISNLQKISFLKRISISIWHHFLCQTNKNTLVLLNKVHVPSNTWHLFLMQIHDFTTGNSFKNTWLITTNIWNSSPDNVDHGNPLLHSQMLLMFISYGRKSYDGAIIIPRILNMVHMNRARDFDNNLVW